MSKAGGAKTGTGSPDVATRPAAREPENGKLHCHDEVPSSLADALGRPADRRAHGAVGPHTAEAGPHENVGASCDALVLGACCAVARTVHDARCRTYAEFHVVPG